MLREFEIPDEVRKQIGGFFIAVVHKDEVDNPHMIMRDGDEVLLGPLLTAGEAETLIPAITAFYVAMQGERKPFAIGLVRLEEDNYTGRFNPIFGLDPDGKNLAPDLYERALEGLQGMLASRQPDIHWLDEMPKVMQEVARTDMGPALSGLSSGAGALHGLLVAYRDPTKREDANLMLDLLLASGGTLPANLLRDLFRVRLIDRWGRKAGDDVA